MLQAIYKSSEAELISNLAKAKVIIDATRPTAVNLSYATKRVLDAASISREFAIAEAHAVADDCAEHAKLIGEYGNTLIEDGFGIETHCNAGWLALVDYGSALAPIYEAHKSGKNIFVYVDETRPRSQGARLTAWELNQEGVLMPLFTTTQERIKCRRVCLDVIVGADRNCCNWVTANKIGTLE
jgi:methylthioribose-1-phosphate isomerase